MVTVNGMVTVAVDPTEGEERRDRRVQVLPSQRKAWYLEISPDSWGGIQGRADMICRTDGFSIS